MSWTYHQSSVVCETWKIHFPGALRLDLDMSWRHPSFWWWSDSRHMCFLGVAFEWKQKYWRGWSMLWACGCRTQQGGEILVLGEETFFTLPFVWLVKAHRFGEKWTLNGWRVWWDLQEVVDIETSMIIDDHRVLDRFEEIPTQRCCNPPHCVWSYWAATHRPMKPTGSSLCSRAKAIGEPVILSKKPGLVG